MIISALKAAEDGNGFIVRAYETEGRAVSTRIVCDPAGLDAALDFAPYEIKTLRVTGGNASETLITELEN